MKMDESFEDGFCVKGFFRELSDKIMHADQVEFRVIFLD